MNEDKANVRRAKRVAAATRRDDLAFVSRLLAEPVGRRWYYNLLASCHIYSSSFSKIAMDMAFSEGERNVGLRLLAEVTAASPELYLLMLKEVEDERRAEDSRNADRVGFADADADDSGDDADS